MQISCAQSPAESAPLTDADVTAIRGVFSRVVETLRAQDWDAFIATFHDDVVFHPANNPPVRGKNELRTWITSGPPVTSEFDFRDVQVSGSGDIAYATSDINMSFEGVPPDQGKQLVVLRRDDAGEWKTIAVSFNSNTPLPTAAPPDSTSP
jgi:ketosteroid isomerase-like protein